MGLPRIVILCSLLNLAGGLLFGYVIGFVPIYTTFNTFNTECEKLTGKEACQTVQHANCIWEAKNSTAPPQCLYLNWRTAPCSDASTESDCQLIDGCTYDYDKKKCNHAAAWSPVESGAFASSMIVGGMIGSTFGSKIVAVVGTKRSVLLTALIAITATVLIHISRATDTYGLLLFGRVLVGVACGIACVACPLYVGEMTPEAYASQVGVLFQVACTLGIFLASAMGLILEPRDFNSDLQMEMRFHVLIGFQLLVSACLIPVGIVLPRSKGEGAHSTETTAIASAEAINEDPKTTLSWGDLAQPIIASVALCSAQQLTGINAIMNYAPNITAAAGLAPLLGNFVVMLWNFVTTLVSIPLAKRITPRLLFLVGAAFGTAACFLTGIAVFPGVFTNETARHALAGLGVFIFIASFEIGMGSSFWIHAQALFPGKYRGPGCSFTLVTQFILNIIINLCFPIAVVALSGGPSKNQHQGLGGVFFFFCGCGLLSVLVLLKTLHPAVEGKRKGSNL